MAAKDGLRLLIREGDGLKKEVDAFALESQGVIEDMGLADRKQRLQKLQLRSKDLIKRTVKAEQKVTKHTKGKEATPVNRFDEIKADELKRLRNIKNRLEKLKGSLVPDETEEEYFRQMGDKEKAKQSSSAVQVLSVGPGANSTLEDDEDAEDDDEEDEGGEKEDDGEEEKEDDQDEGDDKSPSPKPGSKLKRLSLFRRSSKGGKDASPKPSKPTEEGTAWTTEAAPAAGETKKEKKEREKREKLVEKERAEQAKREKREQEKRDKLEKERLEKERKQKEKKQKEGKKGSGKGKTGPANGTGTLEGISEHSEEENDEEAAEDEDAEDEYAEDEDDDNNDKNNSLKSPPKRSLKSPFGRKSKSSQKGSSNGSSNPVEETKSAKEKKGGGGWKLFQRKPDRKASKDKDKDAPVEESSSKKGEEKAQGTSNGTAIEDEDEDEDDDEDEEDEDDEEEASAEEDEEDVSGEEEEEVEDEEEEEVEDEEEEEDDEEEEEDVEDEAEEEEEDDDDEDDEEYEDDSQFEKELGGTGGSDASGSVFIPPDEGMERFQAVCDFDPEQTEDLGFKRGDIVTVLNTRDDGWWMAEDEEGNRGLVPSTYLKLKKDYSDYRDVQSPEHGEEGYDQGARRKSGVQLWKGLRKAMNETSVTDVLTAMGAIPSGFRHSTTAKLLKEDQHTLCHVMKPRLSESNLTFRDIFWDPQENQIRARTVRVQKMISIVMIKNMPQVGAGLETKNRHIRVALFDGDKVLSNIHTVQATVVESDPKTWKFSPKMTGMLPSSLDGDCFVRTNCTDGNIGILFEVCLSYVRTKTGEKGELSCGWVHLPLFDETTGAPVVNKVYDIPIKGGTPYEQDVDVDPSISRKSSTSKFRAMMSANKVPRLVVKLVTTTKEQKAELDTLPDTVVSSACYISLLSSYRKLLADTLLIDRINLQNTDMIHSPVLANFPKATLYPDIMDALRSCWADKKRTLKKSNKRDLSQMKKLFTDACMESIYPLLHSATLPPYKFGDTENEQDRWEEISGLMKETQEKGILRYLLKPGVAHAPITISEVTFDPLGIYHEES